MNPRYITLIVTCNDGGRAYVVADRTKIFFDEKKARAVRDCLNEQDAEIVRALGLAVDEERPQGVVKYEPAAHGEEPAEPVVKNAPGRVEKGGMQ